MLILLCEEEKWEEWIAKYHSITDGAILQHFKYFQMFQIFDIVCITVCYHQTANIYANLDFSIITIFTCELINSNTI